MIDQIKIGGFLRSGGLWLAIGIAGVACLWGIVIRERLNNSAQDK